MTTTYLIIYGIGVLATLLLRIPVGLAVIYKEITEHPEYAIIFNSEEKIADAISKNMFKRPLALFLSWIAVLVQIIMLINFAFWKAKQKKSNS